MQETKEYKNGKETVDSLIQSIHNAIEALDKAIAALNKITEVTESLEHELIERQ